jgi:hypothetical protein
LAGSVLAGPAFFFALAKGHVESPHWARVEAI